MPFSADRIAAGYSLDDVCKEFQVPSAVVRDWEDGISHPPPFISRTLAMIGALERDSLQPATTQEHRLSVHQAIRSESPTPARQAPIRAEHAKDGPRPSLVSLFTGTGGLDIGLEQAGFETLFANEIEPYACESLRANRVLRRLEPCEFEEWFNIQTRNQRCYSKATLPELTRLKRRLSRSLYEPDQYLAKAHIEECDVRKLESRFILEATGKLRGEIDLIAGGPPCQPFSRAGKRELVECDTGQLFLDFVRLVDEIRPRFFLLENVKGLVLHKADVASLICNACGNETIPGFDTRQDLKDAGSAELNCEQCGTEGLGSVVWSKRRAGSLEIIENEFHRIGYKCSSIVLNAADFGAPQLRERLLIVGSRDNEQFEWPKQTHHELSGRRRPPTLFDCLEGSQPRWRTMNQALYGNGHWHYGDLNPERAVLWVKNVVRPHDEPVTWTLDRAAPTIGAHQAAKLAIAPYGVPEEQLFRQQWHVLGRRQGDTRPVQVEHQYLSDEELLQLQTFPASWFLYGTRMQRAFQIGNAVPPVLGKAVGQAIIKAMSLNVIDESKPNEKRYAASL